MRAEGNEGGGEGDCVVQLSIAASANPFGDTASKSTSL